MEAAELTLTILQYTQHLAAMTMDAQKIADANIWNSVVAQKGLKTIPKN